jgi:N-acetylmuramoyl-L-alanine amidase
MASTLEGTLKNRGVLGDSQTAVGGKQGALTGSIFSEVPVLTVEMVVLNNKADAMVIQTKAGQDQMALALANGIIQYVMPSADKGNPK